MLALLLCAALTRTHTLSWNDRSRLATVDALVTAHTFAIEGSRVAAGTQDKYRYGGHVYSDKPPLLSLWAAGVVAALRPLGITLRDTPGAALYAATLATAGIAFAAACAYAYRFAVLLGFAPYAATVAALNGGGTLALPYATVFVNHVPAGAAALAGLFYLTRRRGRDALAAGACLSLAFACDAAAGVYALAGAVLLWGARGRAWLEFAAGAAPLVALQLAYDVRFAGAPLPPALNPALWTDPAATFYGLGRRMTAPLDAGASARFLLSLLGGERGFFSYMPLMFVCAWGWWRMREGAPRLRRLALAVLATFAVYLALVVRFGDVAAVQYGERRYVDVVFALCIALGPALGSLRGGLPLAAARAAAAASVVLAALGTVAPFGAGGAAGVGPALAEARRLAARAPLAALLDVVALAVALVLIVRAVRGDYAVAPRTSRA